MPFVQEMTRTLHKILRGEIAAVEAYERSIRGMSATDPSVGHLERITRDHVAAVETLRTHLVEEGEEPDEGPGMWGAYTRLLEKAGTWLGDDTDLKALKEGEVHGLSEYRTSLGHQDLPPELRNAIETCLIPAQEEHIALLDELLKGRERARHGA